MSKKPEDLEAGDVFMVKIGFDASMAYVVRNEGGVVAFSRFSWMPDEVWTKTVNTLKSDENYIYLGRKRSLPMRWLSLGGLLFPRYRREDG